MEHRLNGVIERDICGQITLTIPHKGEADEWMLLDSREFPEVRCGQSINVEIIIKEKNE